MEREIVTIKKNKKNKKIKEEEEEEEEEEREIFAEFNSSIFTRTRLFDTNKMVDKKSSVARNVYKKR